MVRKMLQTPYYRGKCNRRYDFFTCLLYYFSTLHISNMFTMQRLLIYYVYYAGNVDVEEHVIEPPKKKRGRPSKQLVDP